MSIFREHKTVADRSASDRRRHKQKIDKAIREGIHHIVADESIIGQDGKKKFKIPVRGIKEYRFVYGDNGNKKVGSAPGKDVGRGQKIGEDQKQGGKPNKAGSEKGEEFYDVEITLEELAQYLFADLNLPELKRRQLANISVEKLKRHGYRPDGILPRLDKKKSAIARIKRMKAAGFEPDKVEEGETFPFHEEDLKFRHFKQTPKPCTNAVVFFIMDVSGSMDQDKKFLARSFYFLYYQFLRMKYETIDIVFISHDTEAREVEENDFFNKSTSGGTIASSGLTLTMDIIYKRYHPSSWNIYVAQASDGDNFAEDNEKFIKEVQRVSEVAQMYGYCEIEPEKHWVDGTSKLFSLLYRVQSEKIRRAIIREKDDVWPAFKAILAGKVE